MTITDIGDLHSVDVIDCEPGHEPVVLLAAVTSPIGLLVEIDVDGHGAWVWLDDLVSAVADLQTEGGLTDA